MQIVFDSMQIVTVNYSWYIAHSVQMMPDELNEVNLSKSMVNMELQVMVLKVCHLIVLHLKGLRVEVE